MILGFVKRDPRSAVGLAIIIVMLVVAAAVWGYDHYLAEDGTPSASLGASDQSDSDRERESSSPPVANEAPSYPFKGEQNTVEGAKEVVRFWYAAKNYAGETLNTKPLQRASHTACSYCQTLIDNFQKAQKDDKTFTGGTLTITRWWSEPHDTSDGEKQYLTLYPLLDEEEWEVYQNGEMIDTIPGGTDWKNEVELGYFDGKWIVVSINPA